MRFCTVRSMPKISRKINFSKPFNANPRRSEFGMHGKMDGIMPHDGNSSHRRAHSNEFNPIYINRRVYGPDQAHSLRATRKRLDYDIPGPLYCHRWMKPASDRMEVWNRNWRPRDYIEVDPHIFLKQHKYPKDELMMNPYLRYPLYHRLPLHYRLTMEEPIPVCRDIVNGKGFKIPEKDGHYMFWKKWKRDPVRGRAGRAEQNNLERRTMGQLDADQDLRSTRRMGSGIEGLEYKLIPVNRKTIPYEWPRGKTDKRFYNPLKGGKSENIPGRMNSSTEDNYAFDSLQELWGGVGVIRGHTYSSRMREYPQLKREFNQTWWPDRHYNFKCRSILLQKTIVTTVTDKTLQQITRCGGFDRYILMTSPAKLMSDLGCALKREMCVLLNDPDAALKNIRRHLGSEKKYGRAAANIIYEDLCHFSCPPHVARFINLSPFEACKLQLAYERSEPFMPFEEIDKKEVEAELKIGSTENVRWEDGTTEEYVTRYQSRQIPVSGMDVQMQARLDPNTDAGMFGARITEQRQERRSKLDKIGKEPRFPEYESDMETIRKGLKKQRVGAKYEVDEILYVEGRQFGAALINSNHPKTFQYRRVKSHPDLLTSDEKKWNDLSEPTRTFQG